MENKDNRLGDAAELRRRAEEMAREKTLRPLENLEVIPPEKTWQTLHELRVYQIELEMQNQALRQTQEELESSRMRYFNLYDLAPVGYFTLSEEGLILKANLTASSLLGVEKSALVKKSLTHFIFREDQDIYYHCRQQLFETSVLQVCELRLVKKDGSLFWAWLESTVVQNSESGGGCLVFTVISDITKRKQAEERLKKTMDATIETMSKIIEVKDPYTAGHQQRVYQLATTIAKELDLSQDKIEGIRIASLIHDIGKIGLPSEILAKPTRLTNIEFSLIKEHSQIGYDILKSIDFSYPVANIVLQHHERLDGSGYPNNLKGDKILLEAKIIGVADVVEAMSSHRPYRPALGIDAALEEISQNRGILYDPEVVDACLKLFKEKGFKFDRKD